MKEIIYFYCVMSHNKLGTRYVSGTVGVSGEIRTQEDFATARDAIYKQNGLNPTESVITAFNKV